MTDWYYHEPGQGKIGPLSAEQLRKYFRERRIDGETLVWHDGLREWQPLERMRAELELLGVVPDTALPPPLPARPALRMVEANAPQHASANASSQGRQQAPPSNNRGCLIAAIVVGVLGLVVIAVLAAIALPAYQDYVKRSQLAQQGKQPAASQFDQERMDNTASLAHQLIRLAMLENYAKNGYCPDTFEFDQLLVRQPRLQGSHEDGWFGIDPAQASGSQCAYEVRFYGLGPEIEDKPLRYEVTLSAEEVMIRCDRHQLPAQYVPAYCKG